MSQDVAELSAAVERRCGGKARLNHTAPVRIELRSGRSWDGLVFVFDLFDLPMCRRAYVWQDPARGARSGRIHVVMHLPTIGSAEEAVRRTLDPQ